MAKVFGVGVNDLPDRAMGDPIYAIWQHMLRRCYDPNYLVKKPTYIGCSVAPEWLTFSNFKAWMLRQPWQGNHLDKDILFPGNKLYSPEACVFVTPHTNTVLIDRGNGRGEYPIGVHLNKKLNLFVGQVSTFGTNTYLGCFSNPMDAHAAWQREKAKIIREIAGQQDDWRVEIALLARADQLDNDRLRGVETIKL